MRPGLYSKLASAARSVRVPLRTHSTSAKPYYVTTPIFYVNAEPHIGHLHSGVIADVLCRYADMRAPAGTPPSLLTTGTDEHGMKMQRVAEAQGESPLAMCDRVSQRFRALAEAGDIRFTRFIRTTETQHVHGVHTLWRTLFERGHIYLGKHEGWYAVSDEAFYPESQVRRIEGAPEGAPQYEAIESGQPVEWMAEENYKFRLSHFQDALVRWLEENPDVIQPRSVHERVLDEVRAGLPDLSISRPSARLHWGVEVPGDKSQTIYVWMDALTNYLTALGYPWSGGAADATKAGWPVDVHVVGKDIVRFHTVYWPAFLMAAGLPPPRHVVAHAHWTVQRTKMSKSKGNSVNPFEAIDTYGVDALRFFLMRVGGNIGQDADYSPTVLLEFQRKYLQGQLGNLLSRILAPKIQARVARGSGERLSPPAPAAEDEALLQALHRLPGTVDAHMRRFELAKALAAVFEVVGLANERLQHAAPWAADTPDETVARCVYQTVETLRVCGVLLQAYMPRSMARLLDVLAVPPAERTWEHIASPEGAALRDAVPLHTTGEKIAPLFPRLTEAKEV